jgi:hypothetical protein
MMIVNYELEKLWKEADLYLHEGSKRHQYCRFLCQDLKLKPSEHATGKLTAPSPSQKSVMMTQKRYTGNI